MKPWLEMMLVLGIGWLLAWLEPLPRRGDLGWKGERLAARYLKRQGYLVLERRARDRWGEADLVCIRGGSLIFVEVKTRGSPQGNSPEMSVDRTKRERLVRFAERYAINHELRDWPIRYDVVAIDWPAAQPPVLRHHQDAFDAQTLR